MNADSKSGQTLIVRYRDGHTDRVEAALSIDFESASAILTTEADSTTIPFDELKAIFLLLSGEPGPSTGGELDLTVEFADGEVIRGSADEYNPSKTGFFLYPADGSQHERIFVVTAAIVSLAVENV